MKPMRILACAVPLLLAATQVAAREIAAACLYGVPAEYEHVILQYPDFTVRLLFRETDPLVSGAPDWEVCRLDVLDRKGRTIGGDIRFSSERAVNARRFDVLGKIYVAEMFRTTGAEAAGSPGRPLQAGQIVIWDQASAESGNPTLAPIWRSEKIDPANRYSVAHAYVDGRLIPGFNEYSRLTAPGSPSPIEPVPRVPYDRQSDSDRRIPARYGEVNPCEPGVLAFPDFNLRLYYHYVWQEPPGFGWMGYPTYNFIIYDPATGRRVSGLSFEQDRAFNGIRFVVGGKRYFAEMGFSTEGSQQVAGPSAFFHRPLGPGEIAVWDFATAQQRNRTVAALLAGHPSQSEFNVSYAAGIPLESRFTGTYWMAASVAGKDLDAIPAVLQRSSFTYPEELRGTGFVGHIHGIFEIKPDGTLLSARTTYGNEARFRAAANACIRQWRFSPPLRQGKPVATYISFKADVPDDGSTELKVEFD